MNYCIVCGRPVSVPGVCEICRAGLNRQKRKIKPCKRIMPRSGIFTHKTR